MLIFDCTRSLAGMLMMLSAITVAGCAPNHDVDPVEAGPSDSSDGRSDIDGTISDLPGSVGRRCDDELDDPRHYVELYVSPTGSDDAPGTHATRALRTLDAAWRLIPSELAAATSGYRVNLLPGEIACGPLDPSTCDTFFSGKHGTATAPIVIRSVDAMGNYSAGAATLRGGAEFVDVRHLSLIGITMRAGGGYPTNSSGNNVLHISSSENIILRDLTLVGARTGYQIQEVLKVNQVRAISVECSSVAGAFQVPIDFVAVHGGTVRDNHVFDADSWCIYLKGGTSDVLVERNVFGDVDPERSCSRGFSAGEGNGLEYMVTPWLHYGAYDLKFINNVVLNTNSIGAAVQGGFNILIAHNTFYRVGKESHAFMFTFGARVCDGNLDACEELHDAGGWGVVETGNTGNWIPNQNVYVYNNVLLNPEADQSQWQHFVISGPVSPPAMSNVEDPAVSDANLQIRGNFIANGSTNLTLVGSYTAINGCPPENPTCNEAQLRAENQINDGVPEFVDASHGDFHPSPGSFIWTAMTYAIPNFAGGDAPTEPPVPDGNLNNAVDEDYDRLLRSSQSVPGAFGAIEP